MCSRASLAISPGLLSRGSAVCLLNMCVTVRHDPLLQAITADPQYSLPHVAACISMGRLALFSDNRTKVRLAKEAREEAAAALALDPKSDLAYHLLGRWHYEMAQLGWPVRTLIRVMYGTSLSPGTHQEAMEAYEQASALNPGRLVHRVELGRCYMKLGRHDQALEQLEVRTEGASCSCGVAFLPWVCLVLQDFS